MEPIELDTAIEELETRVERLRALYEQYFMGIEKIPPHVVHKDVERRIYMLRREQIRNTAKRFKLQTIIQRYNTFQQYWMRIMREIENGTYRRHVLRAERTAGALALAAAAGQKGAATLEGPNPAQLASVELGEDLGELGASADLEGLLAGLDLDDPLRRSIPPAAREKARPKPTPSGKKAAPAEADDLEPPPSSEPTRPGLGVPGESQSPPRRRRASLIPAKVVPVETPSAHAGAPPAARAAPPPRPVRTAPAQTQTGMPRPPPPSQRSPKSPEPQAAPPTQPTSAKPASPARGAKPSGSPRPGRATPPLGTLSHDRVERIANKLRDARQQTHEKADVSVEALTRKLEATAAELRKKHAGKTIDFDVVIKNGKAVVKPVVR